MHHNLQSSSSHNRMLLVVQPEYYRSIATITDVARTLHIPRHIKSLGTFIEEYALNASRSEASLHRLRRICMQTSAQGVQGMLVLTCPTLPLSVPQSIQEQASQLLAAVIRDITRDAPTFITIIVANHRQHVPIQLMHQHSYIPSLTSEMGALLTQHLALRVMAASLPCVHDIDFDRLAYWAQSVNIAHLYQTFMQVIKVRPLQMEASEYDLLVAIYHASNNAKHKRMLERSILDWVSLS